MKKKGRERESSPLVVGKKREQVIRIRIATRREKCRNSKKRAQEKKRQTGISKRKVLKKKITEGLGSPMGGKRLRKKRLLFDYIQENAEIASLRKDGTLGHQRGKKNREKEWDVDLLLFGEAGRESFQRPREKGINGGGGGKNGVGTSRGVRVAF